MEYLTYEEYANMGGELDQKEFKRLYRHAAHYLEEWTLGRVKNVTDGSCFAPNIKDAMFSLMGYMPAIETAKQAKASGDTVKTFSNGVNSFTFDNGGNVSGSTVTPLEMAYSEVCEWLPVQLISAAVNYNRGGSNAC